MAPATATPLRSAPVLRTPYGGLASLRRFSVHEYHEMIAKGVLKESDPVELLEGLLVSKMPRSLAHDFAITDSKSDFIASSRTLTWCAGNVPPHSRTANPNRTSLWPEVRYPNTARGIPARPTLYSSSKCPRRRWNAIERTRAESMLVAAFRFIGS
jgi:hypothetical protein